MLLALTECPHAVETEKAIQSIHDGVGDTGSLQVSLHAFSEATLVRHLVVLRIRFTVYRYVDLPTVRSYLYVDLVFRPYVLLYGSGINFYRNNDDAPVIVILNCALTRCVVNEVPTLIFDQVSDNQLPIVESLASEFNVFYTCICFYRLSPLPSMTPRSCRLDNLS